jgi:uncharacterized protein
MKSESPLAAVSPRPPHPPVGPVTLTERILFVDVLRGLALLGILAANMRGFFAPIQVYFTPYLIFHARADIIAQWFVDAFIQGKFVTIFSFLFGLGFAIQMSRAQERGARFMGFYPRRLLALALFGLIHGILIWAGDILLTYAITGAILLFFRNRQQKTLLWWAGGLLLLPTVMGSIFLGLYFSPWRRPWMEPHLPKLEGIDRIIHIYAQGTPREILAQNWAGWLHELRGNLFAILATGIFLLGMWTWRAGIVQQLDRYRPLFRKAALICLPVGLALNFITATGHALAPGDRVTFLGAVTSMGGPLWTPSMLILAAGYVSSLALLFLDPPWRARLGVFAAVGRTALTNYLLQSVLCTLLFYSYTTGWYGKLGPALGWIPTIVLYSLQVVASNLWLRHFRFGPVEWLWRGMTYGKFPAMRIEAPPSSPTPSAATD